MHFSFLLNMNGKIITIMHDIPREANYRALVKMFRFNLKCQVAIQYIRETGEKVLIFSGDQQNKIAEIIKEHSI